MYDSTMKRFFRLLLICVVIGFVYLCWNTDSVLYDLKEYFGIKEEYYQTYDAAWNIYYDSLTEIEKKIYAKMIECANNYEESWKPFDTTITEENIENAYTAVLYDHPELFWLNLGYSYQYLENMGIVEVKLSYNETLDNIDEAKQLFDQSVNTIVDNANMYESDEEKERYVHDTLIEMIEYDESASLNQSAYSALVNHRTVCAGYAKAFQYLMQKLDIPCYFVVGQSEGQQHAWNLVYINSRWMNVDVTWDDGLDDPYYFFNKNDSFFEESHSRDLISQSLPTCE